MGSFTTPLITEQNYEGDLWRLAEEFTYFTGEGEGLGDKITVPVNFITDYLSIPRFLHFLIPHDGGGKKAAVIHDWLYSQAGEVQEICRKYSRKACDEIFREALLASGVEPDTANLFYFAVRRFGARHYGRNALVWDGDPAARLDDSHEGDDK
jgi:hypothetical protein